MYYNLEYIEMADCIYIYNEVNSEFYKINCELWNKIKDNAEDPIDNRAGIRQYLIKKGIIGNDVIYDRIMDCSGWVDISEIVLNCMNRENTETADRLCDKYHMDACKRSIKAKESSCGWETECKEYTLEDILRILFFGMKCKFTDEMIEGLNDSWAKIKPVILNNDTVTGEENYCTNLVFDMITDQKTRLFPCEWGVDKLYIEDGILYSCDQTYKKKLRLNELNSVFSVDEYEPCKLCSIRYLCGGVCDREILKTGRYCEFVYEVFRTLLKIYILKNPNKIIQLT